MIELIGMVLSIKGHLNAGGIAVPIKTVFYHTIIKRSRTIHVRRLSGCFECTHRPAAREFAQKLKIISLSVFGQTFNFNATLDGYPYVDVFSGGWCCALLCSVLEIGTRLIY